MCIITVYPKSFNKLPNAMGLLAVYKRKFVTVIEISNNFKFSFSNLFVQTDVRQSFDATYFRIGLSVRQL